MTEREDPKPGEPGYEEAVRRAIEGIRALVDAQEEESRKIPEPRHLSDPAPRGASTKGGGVKGRNELIRSLIEANTPLDEIVRQTGVRPSTVKSIRRTMNAERIGQGKEKLPPFPKIKK